MIGETALPAERTTPDALTLQRLLREMADAGCTHVVMEVSSHALALDRVYGVGESALSPVCVGGRVDGETLTLTFKNVSRGLIVRGTVTDLEVRDASGTWHAATAVAGDDGITLTVTANGVTPVGVRYANASVPSPSLYDKNGLPVAPFWLDTVG